MDEPGKSQWTTILASTHHPPRPAWTGRRVVWIGASGAQDLSGGVLSRCSTDAAGETHDTTICRQGWCCPGCRHRLLLLHDDDDVGTYDSALDPVRTEEPLQTTTTTTTRRARVGGTPLHSMLPTSIVNNALPRSQWPARMALAPTMQRPGVIDPFPEPDMLAF